MGKLVLLFIFPFILLSCKPVGHPSAEKGQPNTNRIENMDSLLALHAAALMASVEQFNEDGSTQKEDSFVNELVKVLQNKQSLHYSFPALTKKDIQVITSNDGQMRLFSWRSPYSGTMLYMQNVVQLATAQGVMAASFNRLYKDSEDGVSPTPAFTSIYRVKNAPDTCYLLIGYGQMSGAEPYRVMHNITVKNNRFDIYNKIFRTGKKADDEIYVGISYPPERNTAEKPIPEISFDTLTQQIAYPETVEKTNSVELTGRMKKIRFNGKFFE